MATDEEVAQLVFWVNRWGINKGLQNQAMHWNRCYWNSSRALLMQEQEREEWVIYDDQSGFACLVAQLKGPGRRRRSRTQQRRRRTRELMREKGEKKQ